MTVFGINGSPRKDWNTATLLKKALEGAASKGADTELVHLYDLSYQGCISCFACKMIEGPHYGKCAVKDDLEHLLEKIKENAEAIVLGSPVYFSSMTGEIRSFMERLLFPYLVYSQPPTSLFPRNIKTGAIYTMNLGEEISAAYGYKALYASTEMALGMIFGSSETFCCYDTYQFPDYSKVVMGLFDPEKKAARLRDVFPEDCRKAFEFGCRLVSENV
jgi:multimeric flavodoxin WrbA